MKRYIGVLFVLLSGCIMDARQLAGYSNPTMRVKISPITRGVLVEVPTNFQGDATGDYNAETHQVHFELHVRSDVSGVIESEAKRITEQYVALMKNEGDRVAKELQVIGANITESIKALGEAAAKLAPLVAGIPTPAAPAPSLPLPMPIPGPGPPP